MANSRPLGGPSWEVSATARFSANDDGAFVLDVERGVCFALNPLGAKIWKLIQAESSRESLLEALSYLFPEIAIERMAADVDRYVGELLRRGLLKQAPTEPGSARL